MVTRKETDSKQMKAFRCVKHRDTELSSTPEVGKQMLTQHLCL